MPVPHAAPIQDGHGPCNFVAGCNRPGFIPADEPQFFAEFDDAKRFVCNLIESHADSASEFEANNVADSLAALAQDVNLESKPFTTPVIWDVVFWVEEVVAARDFEIDADDMRNTG